MDKKKVDKLKTFLKASGATILDSTNEYELLRFRTENGVSVIYTGRRGVSYVGEAREALEAFEAGGNVWQILRKNEKQRRQIQDALIKRDGYGCFYCGCTTIKSEPGHPQYDTTMTAEHLLSISCGGNNNLANLVIACGKCNKDVGEMPIIEKVKYRDIKLGMKP